MHTIWFERPLPVHYQDLLKNIAVSVGPGKLTGEALMATLDGVEAIIASARVRYDGALMDRVPARVISRTGIGMDNVSIPDATLRGIAVAIRLMSQVHLPRNTRFF